MAGLFGIGVALILGIGMRIATVSAVIMLFLMYLASFPMTTNPIIDDHVDGRPRDHRGQPARCRRRLRARA